MMNSLEIRKLKNSFWLIPLVLVLFLTSSIPQGQAEEKSVNPGDIYDAGIALFYKERYEEAITTFSKIILSFPGSSLVSYSRYMIGQCYLKTEKYDEAIQQFDLYLKTYPDGDRVQGATAGIEATREKLKEKEKTPPTAPKSQPTSEAHRAKRRISAQVFYLEAKDLDEVEKRVKSLKEAGVNTLIFRVFQKRGTGRINSRLRDTRKVFISKRSMPRWSTTSWGKSQRLPIETGSISLPG